MPPTVRCAAPSNAEAISACLAELGYGTSTGLVAAKLAAFAGRAIDAVFVAEDVTGAALSGVISVHVLPLFHASGNAARITTLAVRPEAQGRGVGRALVAAAEGFAWRSDCRRIEVTSGDHRAGAHAFYQALGYALDERRFLKHAPPSAVSDTPPSGEAAG